MNRKLQSALQVSEEGRRYLAEMRAAKKKGRALKASQVIPMPGASREDRRAARNARLATIRDEVMARADGKCELCTRAGLVLEAHHLLSGPIRRAKESTETLIAICADCHRAIHRNQMPVLRRIKEVVILLGMRESLNAIERRIAKIEEARR